MKNKYLSSIFEWFLYMIGYTIVFIITSLIFDSFYIDTNSYFTYSIIAVIIIHILNKTIKPLLFYLTIPITGLTLGLFYPFINLIILKLTDWIMTSHFNLGNTFIAFFIAIIISIMNVIMEYLVIKPITRRNKK